MDASLECLVVGDRLLAIGMDLYFCLISSILYAEEFRTDRITRFEWCTTDDRMIYLFYLPCLEEREESFESFFFFGDHDSPTRISVDSVYERWFIGETIIALPEHILHELDEGDFLGFMISWVDIHPWWLIHDEETLILIEDFECYFRIIWLFLRRKLDEKRF